MKNDAIDVKVNDDQAVKGSKVILIPIGVIAIALFGLGFLITSPLMMSVGFIIGTIGLVSEPYLDRGNMQKDNNRENIENNSSNPLNPDELATTRGNKSEIGFSDSLPESGFDSNNEDPYKFDK